MKKKKKFLLCLLVLTLVIAFATALTACTSETGTGNGDEDEEEPDVPGGDVDIVNTCLGEVNDGLVSSIDKFNDESDPLVEYSVNSTYTIYTSRINYTVTYYAIYDKDPAKSRYYVKLFDNRMHVDRLELFYDASDLYLYAEKEDKTRAWKVKDFSQMLLYNVFDELIRNLDIRYYLFSDFMTQYFAYRSLLYSSIDSDDTKRVIVGEDGKAITFSNIDLSLYSNIANDAVSSYTDGIGTSFDAITQNLLGFSFSSLCEFSVNAIGLEHIRFLFEGDDVNGINGKLEGRMLDGNKYFIAVDYNYDTVTNTVPEGQTLRTRYSYQEVSLTKGSWEGTALFPTIREEEYMLNLDYNINTQENSENKFTLRIYDPIGSSQGTYQNINEFLSLYYTNETLYVNAKGLCDALGAPIALESLHFPKVYFTGFNLSSALQMVYNYLIRVCTVLFNQEARDKTEENKVLYQSLLETIESSEDLSTVSATITETLIKDIREDDTSLSVLLCRALGVADDTIDRYFGGDPFQDAIVVVSYNFVEGDLIFDNYYKGTLYGKIVLHKIDYKGIIFPDDLNELYYTVFSEPEVITMNYDISITPYMANSVDLSQFFGVFIEDCTGKNTPYVLGSDSYLLIRGQVAEKRGQKTEEGENLSNSLDLKFYKKKKSTGEETLLLSVLSNPYDMEQILVGYYMPMGGFDNKTGLFYRIEREKVTAELERLTNGDNLLTGGSNTEILLGLLSTAGASGNARVEKGWYRIDMTTSSEKDVVEDLIGISDTTAYAKLKISFDDIDLSSVVPANYGTPVAEEMENMTVRSIYTTDSKWRENCTVSVGGKDLDMKITYTAESIAVQSEKKEYTPTSHLFGLNIGYTVNILDTEGSFIISSLQTYNTSSYSVVKTKITGLKENGEEYPAYLLVIDPAFVRTLPTTVQVIYDNYQLGVSDCVVKGFKESNILRDGFNKELLAGEYTETMPVYTLQIGNNSIASCTFDIYIAVLSRTVIGYKKDAIDPAEGPVAYINNEEADESLMGLEVQTGTEIIGGSDADAVIGTITIDPYTFAMRKSITENYDLVADELNSMQLKLVFSGYYGSVVEIGEGDERIVHNKYYNKEGYNYFFVNDVIDSWTFDTTVITWEGGVYYAYATFGDTTNGRAVRLALQINVVRKKVTEVKIDDETNSTYTIDYLIASTYDIPTTGGDGHTITIVFEDGSERKLIPAKLGSITTEDYYNEYILGSLEWEGSDELKDKINVNGTAALFGSGKDATSQTKASLGSTTLGVGTQTVTLNVLQPSRYQSDNEAHTDFVVTSYTVDNMGGKETVTPEYGYVSVSNAKFRQTDNPSEAEKGYVPFEINPYDYTASLPGTVWLYVVQSGTRKVWKEYDVQWTIKSKPKLEGAETQFINLIKEENGKFVLAHPSTEQRDLVVYGTVGDGNGIIWVTMVVRNLYSALQSADFYLYTYEQQTVTTGKAIDGQYFEYIEDGYARTSDASFQPTKYYYTKGELSGKTVYNRFIPGETASISDGIYYEKVTKGYGLSEDRYFEAGKNYYLYIKKSVSVEDTIYVDPYLSYDDVIPTEYTAVLGSGAEVSSSDKGTDGKEIGLTWFVILPGDDNEYPLTYSREYEALSTVRVAGVYYKRYDEEGKFIFPYNAGIGCGLKCYISGSGNITNAVVLSLTVYERVVKSYTDSTHDGISSIDIYNNDEDIYTDEENEKSLTKQNIYSNIEIVDGKQTDRATALKYIGIDRYTLISTAIGNRLERMKLSADKDVFVGVLFSATTYLYSLPVIWEEEDLGHILAVFYNTEEMTDREKSNGGMVLVGKICAGTVNEQMIRVFFSVRTVSLTAVNLINSQYMIANEVYQVKNDTENVSSLCTLTVTELSRLDGSEEYNFEKAYQQYIGSTVNLNGNMKYNSHKYVIVFESEKSYGFAKSKSTGFCSPYEYMLYLFSNLTLEFTGGGDALSASASGKIVTINAIGEKNQITYFNNSVLGLNEKTYLTDSVGNIMPYTYSFLELKGFSEGSAQNDVLLVVKARRAEMITEELQETVEVFKEDLGQAYAEGYALPSRVDILYSPLSGGYVVTEDASFNEEKNYFILDEEEGFVVRNNLSGAISSGLYYEYRTDGCFVLAIGNFLENTNYYVYNHRFKQYVLNAVTAGEEIVEQIYYTFVPYSATNQRVEYVATYLTEQWNISSDTDTIKALGTGTLTDVIPERLDVINGATYKFYYVLPCSEKNFKLDIIVPQKDIGVGGYSATGDLYPIKNGVIEIDNPFRFVSYNNIMDRFEIDESLIPTEIVISDDNDTYTKTQINGYKINWTFHYSYVDETTGATKFYLDSNLFEEGKTFVFGTFSYKAYYTYNGDKNEYEEKTCELQLILKLAKLSFYGFEVSGQEILLGDDAGSNPKKNVIEIDPYGSDSTGTYTLPTEVTILFNSLQPGAIEGTRVSYTFSGVRYTTNGSNISSVVYDQSGISENMVKTYAFANKNIVSLEMKVVIGTNVGNRIKYFADGVPVTVKVLSRIIDSIQIPNLVYEEGTLSGHAFVEATVESGKTVTSGIYYEYHSGLYTVTTDTTFVRGKTYYIHSSVSVFRSQTVQADQKISGIYYEYIDKRFVRTSDTNFDGNKTYYYRLNETDEDASVIRYKYVTCYEKAEGNFEENTSYYKVQKATVTSGNFLYTDYYRLYEGYEKATAYNKNNTYGTIALAENLSSTYTSGVTQISDTTMYRYIDEVSLWVSAFMEIYNASATYGRLTPQVITDKEDGEALDGYFCEVSFYLPMADTEEVYTVVTEVKQGETYYSPQQKMVIVGDDVDGTCWYLYEEGIYKVATGTYKQGVAYFTFVVWNSVIGGERFEKTTIRNTFDDQTYSVMTRMTDYTVGDSVSGSVYVKRGNRYEKQPEGKVEYINGESYYTFENVTVQTGYYLSEKYYVYSGNRYILSNDEKFSKTKKYYIFRPITLSPANSVNVYAIGKEIPSDVYILFEGYEATSYYAFATRKMGETIKYTNNAEGRTEYEMPIYYIDPYNTSSFRLPTEINIRFTSFEAGVYRSYKVRGWTLYDELKGTYTDFITYSDRNDVSNQHFYSVASENGYTYGYFQPQEDDFTGKTYLLAGYISVGNARQYFYVVVVVLNRSLQISDEMNRSYTLTYDFTDPIGAMLTDIPVSMEEEMFVLYDSYYICFDLYGVSYAVDGESLFGFNNGNNPFIPTILWQESYDDGETSYDFNTLIDKGYSGKLYGNVHADDLNFANLYNLYYYQVYDGYSTLIQSGMWDKMFEESFVAGTKTALQNYEAELEKDVLYQTYTLLCTVWNQSTDKVLQQYYTFLAESYVSETLTRLANEGILYTWNEENRRDIVVYMYSQLQDEVSKTTGSSRRKEIFTAWTDAITLFKTENYTASSNADLIHSEVTAYQKLKAKYYQLMVDNNKFQTDETAKNTVTYIKMSNALTDSINRDIWDILSVYADASVRAMMSTLYVASDNVSNAKSVALQALLLKEKEGVNGEETVADVNMPQVTFVQIVDDKGNAMTTIDFNLFSYDSLLSAFNVQFIVSYKAYYEQKEREAEDDITKTYRKEYVEIGLDELMNVLMEAEINDIAPVEVSGMTETVQLAFRFNGVDYTFSYDNYMAVLRQMVSISGSSASTVTWTREKLYSYLTNIKYTLSDSVAGVKNYYNINTALWESLVDYYENYSLSPLSGKGEDLTAWNGIKSYYQSSAETSPLYYPTLTLGSKTVTFSETVGTKTYTEYNALMVAVMNQFEKDPNYTENSIFFTSPDLFDALEEKIQTYYPSCWELQQYYDYQLSQVYYLVADGLLDKDGVGIYSTIHTTVFETSDKEVGTAKTFVSMYNIAGDITFNLADMLYRWEQIKSTFETESESDYYKAFQKLEEEKGSFDSKERAFLARYYIVDSGTINENRTLYDTANSMIEFLTGYVLNTGGTAYALMKEYLQSNGDFPFTYDNLETIRINTIYGSETVVVDSVIDGGNIDDRRDSCVFKGSSNFNALAPSLYRLYYEYNTVFVKYGMRKVSDVLVRLSQYLLYKGLQSAWKNAETDDTIAKNASTLMDSWKVNSGVKEKTEAVMRLMNNNASAKTRLISFFRDPSATYDKGTALYCVPSLAFTMLLETKEKAGDLYNDKRTELTEEHIEKNLYKESYNMLESLYGDLDDVNTQLTTGGKTVGTNYATNLYAYYYYYRTFLIAGGVIADKGYARWESVTSTSTKETVSVPKTFAGTVTAKLNPETYFDTMAHGNITSSFLKDYPLRAVLYFYDHCATRTQKNIIEEVARLYIGSLSFNEENLASEYAKSGFTGQDFYANLLCRSDLGADREKLLSSAYYALYLEEGINMIAYAVNTIMDNNYVSQYTQYYADILGVDKLSTQVTNQSTFIGNSSLPKYRQAVYNAIVKWYDGTNSGSSGILNNKKAEMETAYKSELYDILYADETYTAKMDEILEYIVKNKDLSSSSRYVRVLNLLRQYKGVSSYPTIANFYEELFDMLERNLIDEKAELFLEGVEMGLLQDIEEGIYDQLYIFTLTKESFAEAVLQCLNLTGYNYQFFEMCTDVDELLQKVKDESNEKLIYTTNKDGSSSIWWNNLGWTLTDTEQNLLRNVYQQQWYACYDKNNPETTVLRAYASTILQLYRFLGRVADYRDGKGVYEGKKPLERGYLTSENILNNDYSTVTIGYKSFLIRLFIENDEFMAGYNGNNSLTLMQNALQQYYSVCVAEKRDYFATITGATPNVSESDIDFIIRCLTEEATGLSTDLDEWNATIESIMTVLGHTSVYVNLDMSSENPLRTFRQEVIKEVAEGFSGENEKAFGRLSLHYYAEKCTEDSVIDYEKALTMLLDEVKENETQAEKDAHRVVTETFYSADHLTEADEEKLRHVIYFDAGRTEWKEYDSASVQKVSPNLENARIYLTNANKTKQSIIVTASKFRTLYGYDFTEKTVTVDNSLGSTKITFTNAFTGNSVSFQAAGYTEVKVRFDGEKEDNTLSIDALNPVLPDKVRVSGKRGNDWVDLGYKTGIEYDPIFQTLIYRVDEATKTGDGEYGAVKTDDMYVITLPADSGMDYHLSIKTQYYNRAVKTVYTDTTVSSYSGDKDPVTFDGNNYYSLEIDNVTYGNGILIDPLDTGLIVNNNSYKLPSTVMIEYVSGDRQTFTKVQWDTSNITYSLTGTSGKGVNGFVSTRILSCCSEGENGTYRILTYTYGSNPKIHIDCYDNNDRKTDTIEFSLDGDIDWNIAIRVADKHATEITAESNGSTVTVGEKESESYVIDASKNNNFRINQYNPDEDFPSQIYITFGTQKVSPEDLKKAGATWSYNKKDIKDIVRAGSVGTESQVLDYTFIATLNYLGYEIDVRFSTYKDIQLGNIGMIYGGTLYVCRSDADGAVYDQISAYYSYTYFNFGNDAEPNWKKIPVYFSGQSYDGLSAKTEKTYEGILATLGAKEGNVLNQNIIYTVQVVSLKRFAELEGKKNNYVSYDYYGVAKNIQNERQTSTVDEPDYMGEYFLTDADSSMQFNIAETKYDFLNEKVTVTVEYDIRFNLEGREDKYNNIGVDSRLGNANAETKRSFAVEMPLYSYLYTLMPSGSSSTKFNKDASSNKWTWKTGETDAIYWTLGDVMTASDLPTLSPVGASGTVIRAYWDLNGINVNEATEEGYVIQAYYFTEANKWENKSLTVYIEKEDITDSVLIALTGSKNEKKITRTYDGKFYSLPLSLSRLCVRKDGTREKIDNDNFVVYYRAEGEGEEQWSTENFPINAGTYQVKVVLDDYNMRLSGADGDDYLILTLIIEMQVVDIEDLTFLYQDGKTITVTYSGQALTLQYADWFTTSTEKSELYQRGYNIYGNENEAKAFVYDVVYDRSTAHEKGYLDILYSDSENELKNTQVGWTTELTEAQKLTLKKAWVYDRLKNCCLPQVNVDGWFTTESEKDSLYHAYMNGNGSGSYAGVLLSETEAKAVAYTVMYNRVNDSMKAQMSLWYQETANANPTYAETQIRAKVYTDKMQATPLIRTEVTLNIIYQYNNIITTVPPTDVGDYTVLVSIQPEDNYGNYISSSSLELTYYIVKDTTIRYELLDTEVSYNGIVSNPNISGITDENGNLAKGVTVTYTYTYVRNGITYVLVVERTSEKASIVRNESSSGLTKNGIVDVGEYSVSIKIDGGNNFISTGADYEYVTTDLTYSIVPADIFIELEDIDAYYLSDVKDLAEFVRIYSSAKAIVCPQCGGSTTVFKDDDGIFKVACNSCKEENNPAKAKTFPISLSNMTEIEDVFDGGEEFICAKCKQSLLLMKSELYYCMVCPVCNVEMRVEFSHGSVLCMCNDCLTERESGKAGYASLEESGNASEKQYTVYCSKSNVKYYISINTNRLLGAETIGDLGELIVTTAVQSYYPVGSYQTSIGGLRLKGATDAYTSFSEQTYAQEKEGTERADELAKRVRFGEYRKLLLLSASYPSSLYASSTTDHDNIKQMFQNYNIYVKTSSAYTISPEGGAVVVTNSEELNQLLYGLEDGDDVVVYLTPNTYDKVEIGTAAQKDADGNFVYDGGMLLTKSVNANITLIGYYNALTKDIETIVKGIVLKKGTLTLKIIALQTDEEGGVGLDIRKTAGSVKVYETLFTKEGTVSKTTGIRVEYGYSDKLYVGEGCSFCDLNTGINLEDGDLEITDSAFARNGIGIDITSGNDDINIQNCSFVNHSLRMAIRSTNTATVILYNVFDYNKVAIRIRAVGNDDMYICNTFENESGINTNGEDIVTDEDVQ